MKWMPLNAGAATIANQWLIWYVNRRLTAPAPKPATKWAIWSWLFNRSRWVYLSSAIIAFGILALLLQVFSDAPVTRFSVFIIAYLTTIIIVQILLTVVVRMRRDLQHAKMKADLFVSSHSI